MDSDPSHLAELVAEVGSEQVCTDPDTMQAYRRDWCKAGEAGMPLAVLRARTAAHVQAGVRWASRHGIPIVPRGAGSGLSAGSNAIEGGLTISLDRMTQVRIDPATRTATVEPGALNVDVKRAAAEHGLTYPPDPSSFEMCSIGGNLATNAGGLCCVKYGVTTDYVLGLDVVLADGSLVRLGGRNLKDVAGLPLIKLFVGSEGTLGIFTSAVLRLVPTPAEPATLVALFATPEAAAHGVVRACARVRPAMLELMDNATINAVEDYRSFGLDRSAGALVLAQSDAPGDARIVELDSLAAEFAAAGASEIFQTHDAEEAEMFTMARRSVLPAVEAQGAVLLEDVGVPVPRLPELVNGVTKIAAEVELRIPVVAHAGDGNTHPIVVFDQSDPVSVERAYHAFDEIMRLAIGLGGTITGEHGVGRFKSAMLPVMLGDEVMDLNRRIKRALDPENVFNPGALFPE
ncbi:MAG: FAD-binding oxidoreductase [Actinomycetales bacterium]